MLKEILKTFKKTKKQEEEFLPFGENYKGKEKYRKVMKCKTIPIYGTYIDENGKERTTKVGWNLCD